jgi:hypothetical protein
VALVPDGRAKPEAKAAEWLSGQQEPDIDLLVPKVERAIKA